MSSKKQRLKATLYYAHDPMCSWCWAYAPTWADLTAELSTRYPNKIAVHKLLGGLAPDSDEPMPDSMRKYLYKTWETIQQKVPGTQFNFDFWTRGNPRRSTWPACRAVIAARHFGPKYDGKMTLGIQRAYYVMAQNPSDRETLVEVATDIGIDPVPFVKELESDKVREAHDNEMRLVRQLGIQGFPSLVLVIGEKGARIPVDYNSTASSLTAIDEFMTKQAMAFV